MSGTVYVITEFDGMDCPERVVAVWPTEAEAQADISPNRQGWFTVHAVPFYGSLAAEAAS